MPTCASCSRRWCCSATRRSWRRSAAGRGWCSTRCRRRRSSGSRRVHRQAADSPILDLADALADPDLGFEAFERMVEKAAARDARVVVSPRVDAGAMARAPVLVWRNATRVRLIHAFRAAHGAPEDALVPGRAADLRRHRAAAQAPQEADGPRGARADQGGAGDLPRAERAAGLRAALRRRRRGPAGRGRLDHPARGARARPSRASSPRRAWGRCSCTARR